MGITLDSLLKLPEAKAHDRKTSILHGLIQVIKKNEPDVLAFTEDLQSVRPASKILLELVLAEIRELEAGWNILERVAQKMPPPSLPSSRSATPSPPPPPSSSTFTTPPRYRAASSMAVPISRMDSEGEGGRQRASSLDAPGVPAKPIGGSGSRRDAGEEGKRGGKEKGNSPFRKTLENLFNRKSPPRSEGGAEGGAEGGSEGRKGKTPSPPRDQSGLRPGRTPTK
ncbi:formin like protein [Nannochloropsis gaditana]|uniref:Formin like protein n=1 Tax=Nannochloropsis gaditana TaxID=72520 RepID=W7TRW4_9STRA|nr:formin like protein [Nannochloropsis gaditana]